MTQQPQTPAHPLLRCLADLENELEAVREVQPTFMAPADKRAALVAVARVEAQVAELRLRLMADCGDIAEADGARDVGAWFAHETRADRRDGRVAGRLAEGVERRVALRHGMATGTVSEAQARVVVDALDALPDSVGTDIVERAETQLVAWCEEFTPAQLRRLGRRILEVVAPEIADEEDARRLLDEERHARDKTRLTLTPAGDGTTKISGLLPDHAAARLRTYLEAFASPRHPAGTLGGEGDRIPYSRKLGQAFVALLEHVDPAKLPDHGGDATTVIVTLTLDDLRSDLGTAGLLDGDLTLGPNLSASEARRLACTARIIPVVLGNQSEILDVGMADRLFRPAQRKALRLRDQRCRAEGCDVPATWCEAHHLRPWSEGGPTDLDNGILICPSHHHRVHDPAFEHELLPNGDLRIRRAR